MTDIQSKIDEIQSLLQDRIGHFQYSHKAKIPYKVHSLVEVMNLRMTDFCEATDILIRNNHIIPSLNLIRTLFENVAITYRVSSAMEDSLKANRLIENFDDFMEKLSFGTRYDEEVQSINVLTNIDKLDKNYKGFREFYDSLCEFVHPNWDGVEGSYSEINEHDKVTSISKIFKIEHPLYKWFESCFLLCLTVHLDCYKNIKSNLPRFATLCENELNVR